MAPCKVEHRFFESKSLDCKRFFSGYAGAGRASMSEQKDSEHQAYFGLKIGDHPEDWKQFSYSNSLDDIEKWARSHKELDSPAEVNEEVFEEEDKEVKSVLSDLMDRVLDSGLALSELIMSSGAVKSLFSSIISRVDVVDPIRSSCPIVLETDGAQVYGISADRLMKVRDTHRRLQRMDRGFDLLPSAVLLAIVATFDSLTADIVRQMLTYGPDRFRNSEKTISISDVLSMHSFDDVKNKLIDDEVYVFSRGSHDEQVKSIEKWFGIKIGDNWKRWADFIEIFERRNLIAHGEKKFTKRYVSICVVHGHKGSEKMLGEDIELSRKYLSQSLDVLMEFGFLLIFSIWRKQIPDDEGAAFDEIIVYATV